MDVPPRFQYAAERVKRRFRRPARPPKLSPGTVGGPPAFIGIGTQRSGTTWWYELVMAHPGVSGNAANRKELHFFDRFFTTSPTDADILEYHRYFPETSSVTGEWTPGYLYDPWTAPALARAAPNTGLLVILRDPIERYRSGLALSSIAVGRRANKDWAVDAFSRGCYHSQLTRLERWFPRNQVLVLQYERCITDPAGELRRTYDFLGLDDSGFRPARLAQPVNVTGTAKVELDPALKSSLRDAYEPDVAALTARYPEVDLDLWENFRPAR